MLRRNIENITRSGHNFLKFSLFIDHLLTDSLLTIFSPLPSQTDIKTLVIFLVQLLFFPSACLISNVFTVMVKTFRTNGDKPIRAFNVNFCHILQYFKGVTDKSSMHDVKNKLRVMNTSASDVNCHFRLRNNQFFWINIIPTWLRTQREWRSDGRLSKNRVKTCFNFTTLWKLSYVQKHPLCSVRFKFSISLMVLDSGQRKGLHRMEASKNCNRSSRCHHVSESL